LCRLLLAALQGTFRLKPVRSNIANLQNKWYNTVMSALFEVSRILSSPLGSLVYHLLLLLAIQAILGMALEEWRRTRRGPAQRLLVGFAGLTLLRLVYVVAALLAKGGWFDRTAVLPPLERFADTASLALLVWALPSYSAARFAAAPASSGNRQAQAYNAPLVPAVAAGLAIGTIVAVAACVTSVALWGQQLARAASAVDYNLSWQAIVWSSLQIGLALLLAWSILRNRGESQTASWAVFFLGVIVILSGRILQLLSAIGLTNTLAAPHLPIWERLANLIAYPLFVVALYQTIVVDLRVRSRQFQAISQASMDQIKSLLFLFEASREMSSSLDLPTVLDNAAQGIARALDADQCAIAFPQDNDPGQMRLAAIYNPARHGRGEGVAFPVDYQLAVQQALRRKRTVIVEETDNVQIQVLFALLGSSDIGPLLIQPLLSDNDAIGAIIVGNSRSQRVFTANEAKLCQSMADQVVGAIQNARRYRALQAKTEDAARATVEERRAFQQAKAQTQDLTDRLASLQAEAEEIRRREETAREARNALEIKLVSSRAETESLTDRLTILESDLAQTHANAEAQLSWHKIELARQEAAWQEALQAQERLRSILHSLTAGLIIADHEGRIIEANVASQILLDRDAEQLQGADLRTINDDPRWRQAVLTTMGGPDRPAVRLALPVGPNTLLCDLAPIPTSEGGQGLARGIVVVIQDISTELEQHRNHGVGVSHLIETAVADSQPQLKAKALILDLDLPDSLPAVEANLDDLRPAMANLLLNACLVSPMGGRIQVQASRSPVPGADSIGFANRGSNGDSFVIISVRDWGGGLPHDALGLVFDRTRPGHTPHGLGASGADLALVKTLVESQRGHLWVETENGVGTTFTLALPIEEHG